MDLIQKFFFSWTWPVLTCPKWLSTFLKLEPWLMGSKVARLVKDGVWDLLRYHSKFTLSKICLYLFPPPGSLCSFSLAIIPPNVSFEIWKITPNKIINRVTNKYLLIKIFFSQKTLTAFHTHFLRIGILYQHCYNENIYLHCWLDCVSS